jgi:hypothetical protein
MPLDVSEGVALVPRRHVLEQQLAQQALTVVSRQPLQIRLQRLSHRRTQCLVVGE